MRSSTIFACCLLIVTRVLALRMKNLKNLKNLKSLKIHSKLQSNPPTLNFPAGDLTHENLHYIQLSHYDGLPFKLWFHMLAKADVEKLVEQAFTIKIKVEAADATTFAATNPRHLLSIAKLLGDNRDYALNYKGLYKENKFPKQFFEIYDELETIMAQNNNILKREVPYGQVEMTATALNKKAVSVMGVHNDFFSLLEHYGKPDKPGAPPKLAVSRTASNGKPLLTLSQTPDPRFCSIMANGDKEESKEVVYWMTRILDKIYGIQTVPHETHMIIGMIYYEESVKNAPMFLLECFVVEGVSELTINTLRATPVSKQYQKMLDDTVRTATKSGKTVLQTQMGFVAVSKEYTEGTAIDKKDMEKLLFQLGAQAYAEQLKDQKVIVKGTMRVVQVENPSKYVDAMVVDDETEFFPPKENSYALVVSPRPADPSTNQLFAPVVRRVSSIINLDGSTYAEKVDEDTYVIERNAEKNPVDGDDDHQGKLETILGKLEADLDADLENADDTSNLPAAVKAEEGDVKGTVKDTVKDTVKGNETTSKTNVNRAQSVRHEPKTTGVVRSATMAPSVKRQISFKLGPLSSHKSVIIDQKADFSL
eukprot:Platyproteum_vivax@DN2072_c0_g1_i1.p1